MMRVVCVAYLPYLTSPVRAIPDQYSTHGNFMALKIWCNTYIFDATAPVIDVSDQ